MKLPQAAGRCWEPGDVVSPSEPREPNWFLNKNSSNERRKRVKDS